MERRREIYIKVGELPEIAHILKDIRRKEEQMKLLFREYDRLNDQENKICENWGNYLEEIYTRMDHVRL